jgi:hypothetical protein
VLGTVFISSTYADQKDLRQQLANRLHAEGHRVFIAEPTSSVPGFIDSTVSSARDVIEVSDQCLHALAKADVVICVLSGSLGTQIRVRDTLFRAKHFELELFSALLQHKPILLCALPDFTPDLEAAGFIECFLEGNTDYARLSNDRELFDSAVSFCARYGHKRYEQRGATRTRLLIRNLSILRAAFRSIRSHQMLLPFLGRLPVADGEPNLDTAEQALIRARGERNLHLRFSRLWIALRELLPTMPQPSADAHANALWEELLSSWISAGSWYGLHGHLYLGTVAAATGLWHLRAARHNDRNDRRGMPVGSIVSTNYSLIQRIPSAPIQYLAFRSLCRFIDRHMHVSDSGPQILLIRGSINLRIWNPLGAASDFREALRVLEAKSAPPHEIADAKTHLALPLAFLGQRRQARKLIDEGLAEMRHTSEPGFMLRALRKAIQIEKLPFGDQDRAAQFKHEAEQIGNAEGYLDQSRHFEDNGSS